MLVLNAFILTQTTKKVEQLKEKFTKKSNKKSIKSNPIESTSNGKQNNCRYLPNAANISAGQLPHELLRHRRRMVSQGGPEDGGHPEESPGGSAPFGGCPERPCSGVCVFRGAAAHPVRRAGRGCGYRCFRWRTLLPTPWLFILSKKKMLN